MENSGFVTKEDRDEVESDFPLTKLFELWCPIYMSYGMSYDDYWNGEPRMCKFYKEAYDIRRKRDDEDDLDFRRRCFGMAMKMMKPVKQNRVIRGRRR